MALGTCHHYVSGLPLNTVFAGHGKSYCGFHRKYECCTRFAAMLHRCCTDMPHIREECEGLPLVQWISEAPSAIRSVKKVPPACIRGRARERLALLAAYEDILISVLSQRILVSDEFQDK